MSKFQIFGVFKLKIKMNIGIIGSGAWGTALGISLAERHNVLIWGRNKILVSQMKDGRQNKIYLPEIKFPDPLKLTDNFSELVSHVSDGLLFVATPISGLRPIMSKLSETKIENLICLAKGIESETAFLPHQIFEQKFNKKTPFGVLFGPSFALEVAKGLPCALTIASKNSFLCSKVVSEIHSEKIRVYTTNDLIGVEIGGALKNILAIATGISDGMNLGSNARAAIMTRGLAEMSRLGIFIGGQNETFMGLTGLGDLILTCTGNLSRNRQVGLKIAHGKNLNHIVKELGHVAEGVQCLETVKKLAILHKIDMPIVNAVSNILFYNEKPSTAINKLLSRESTKE